jgi:uncharacterized radical SAM superfamily Fe-S cluster-containing enzyme
METLGITHSVCEKCRAIVPAKVVTDGTNVFFRKFCREHGETENFVYSDLRDYLASQRYVKPAWVPLEFSGNLEKTCPDGCGFCGRHEQHLCMPIVEITSRCNLACPVCLVDAGHQWDMTMEEFRSLLDRLVRAERQIEVLNLSGGEPLLHPQILAFVDEALSRKEVVRVSISTNGLQFLSDRELLRELHARNVVISLQFDGFEEKPYEILRGKRLLREKLQILNMLAEEEISTSLTMTAAGGVNDNQFRKMLDYLFSNRHVVSLMIQPIAFVGRGANLADKVRRLTIPDITRALGKAQHPFVATSHFLPLPCSHPLCFSLAFYLVLSDGRAIAVNKLTKADSYMDSLANRVIFGLDRQEHIRLREMIYELWSGPAGSAPDSEAVLRTLRDILSEISSVSFEPRQAFTLAERRVKSIFIHAFQDAQTFDLARARRCCNAYPQPDGRLIPACVHNIFLRKPLSSRQAKVTKRKTVEEVRDA